MSYLKVSPVLACAVALAVTSSCSDMPAPLEPDLVGLEMQLQQTEESREVCWYVGSSHPDYKRHVVSGQDTFEDEYGYRFTSPLELPEGTPETRPLVAHVINLFKFGSYAAEDRVGSGYVVSVVERRPGSSTYDMFHQVVLWPWLGPDDTVINEMPVDTATRDWGYNQGLCDESAKVPVCIRYTCKEGKLVTGSDGKERCDEWEVGPDGHVECETFVYRPACVGSFLGTASMTCNKLPCTSNLHRASLTFDWGSWDGFGTLSDGGMHHGRGGELRAGTGDDALLFGWHHGNLCVTVGDEGGDPAPDPDPDPEEPKCNPGMRNRGLC